MNLNRSRFFFFCNDLQYCIIIMVAWPLLKTYFTNMSWHCHFHGYLEKKKGFVIPHNQNHDLQSLVLYKWERYHLLSFQLLIEKPMDVLLLCRSHLFLEMEKRLIPRAMMNHPVCVKLRCPWTVSSVMHCTGQMIRRTGSSLIFRTFTQFCYKSDTTALKISGCSCQTTAQRKLLFYINWHCDPEYGLIVLV